MFDGLTIGGAIAGLKTAGEILKGLLSLRDTRMIEAEIAKLTPIILSAQKDALSAYQEQLALLDQVCQLKARVVELEGKGSQTERYKRTNMGGGGIAYTLKDGVEEGEADHAACANCYEKGHVSTLQSVGKSARSQDMYKCPSCKETFKFGVPQEPGVIQRLSYGWDRRRR